MSTDCFTKLTLTIPFASTRSWRFLNEFSKRGLLIYCASTSILKVNGQPFSINFYQEVFCCLGINCLFTNAYQPKENGQADHFKVQSCQQSTLTSRITRSSWSYTQTPWSKRTIRRLTPLLIYSVWFGSQMSTYIDNIELRAPLADKLNHWEFKIRWLEHQLLEVQRIIRAKP